MTDDDKYGENLRDGHHNQMRDQLHGLKKLRSSRCVTKACYKDSSQLQQHNNITLPLRTSIHQHLLVHQVILSFIFLGYIRQKSLKKVRKNELS